MAKEAKSSKVISLAKGVLISIFIFRGKEFGCYDIATILSSEVSTARDTEMVKWGERKGDEREGGRITRHLKQSR
jgi:hypothetical protein